VTLMPKDVARDPAGDRIRVGIGEMDRQLLQSEFPSVWFHRGQREEGGRWRGSPRGQIETAAAAGKAQKDPPMEMYEHRALTNFHSPTYQFG